MNLEYGPEYEDFRAEVIDFCKEYEGISFENTSSKNRYVQTRRGKSFKDIKAR